MKLPDIRNLYLFIVYPVIALFIILCVAVVLIAAWPAALFYNQDKKPNETAKDQDND